MLRDAIALVVICLIVLGCVYIWFPQSSSVPWAAPAPVVAVADKKADSKHADKTGSAAKSAARPVYIAAAQPAEQKPETVVEELAQQVAAVPAPVVHRVPPPFPTVEKIAAGQREEAITQKYGDPALSSLTSNGHHVVETLVYAADQGRLATVIRLEDGKVASAYAQAEPAKATGLSAPQRWRAN